MKLKGQNLGEKNCRFAPYFGGGKKIAATQNREIERYEDEKNMPILWNLVDKENGIAMCSYASEKKPMKLYCVHKIRDHFAHFVDAVGFHRLFF